MLASVTVPVKDRRGVVLVLVLAGVFLPALLDGWPADPPRRFVVISGKADVSSAAVYTERFIDERPSERVLNTPTLGELPNGDLLAVWKVGQKTEPQGVSFHAATYDRASGVWGPVRALTSSGQTQVELGRVVRTLANPVLLTERDGTVNLLYVTAWARWSTSSLALKTSTDRGRTWSAARRIVTSPVANIATLVKTEPFRYTDGTVGVPAYHEFVGVFPQLLRFSSDGDLIDKVRIHRGQEALQPSIVPLDDRRGLALMRNTEKGQHILIARTDDGGLTWGPVGRLELPNPNAPVMGARLRDGAILLVFNNSSRERERLSLALSGDGGERWTVFHTFENRIQMEAGPILDNYAYPYLFQASDGMVHVLYSWNQTHLKHVSFNHAWIHRRTR
jgi:predicted neuraminidase